MSTRVQNAFKYTKTNEIKINPDQKHKITHTQSSEHVITYAIREKLPFSSE